MLKEVNSLTTLCHGHSFRAVWRMCHLENSEKLSVDSKPAGTLTWTSQLPELGEIMSIVYKLRLLHCILSSQCKWTKPKD
jgi:hypothetical protein